MDKDINNKDDIEVIILPIEDSIDLHTFHPVDIPDVVKEYINECISLGYKEVRIIHGKGKGHQRAIVQNILKTNPYVKDFKDAPYDRGGFGATVVYL
jgi:dsDNA-specific endonuclease/ATPase MutS2